MAKCYQSGTGVRDGGQAGLAEKSHISPLEQGAKRLQLGRRRVLVQHMQLQLFHPSAESGGAEKPAGAPKFLHHEYAQSAQHLKGARRKHNLRCNVSQGSGDKVKFTHRPSFSFS